MLNRKIKFDVAIIGGGLAGLSAAALLTKKGYKIFLAEKNSVCGGNASMIEKNGFSFERALRHLYGLGTEGAYENELIKEIGISTKIEFINIPTFIKAIYPDFSFTFPSDYEELKDSLSKEFPDERYAINKMLEQGRKLFQLNQFINAEKKIEKIPNLVKDLNFSAFAKYFGLLPYLPATFEQYCKSNFKNPKLISLLGTPWVYLGVPPSKAPAILMIAMLGAYCFEKTYYIRGGTKKLVETIQEVIIKNGGKISTGFSVKKIITKANNIYQIIFENGKKIEVNSIIWACDPHMLKENFEINTDYYKKIENLSISISAFNIMIASKLNAEKLKKFISYENGFFESYDHEENYRLSASGKISSFGICVQSMADPSLAPSGHSTITIISFAPFINKEFWKKNKNEHAMKIINKVEKIIPEFKKNIIFYEIITPSDINAYTNVTNGAIYGWENNITQTLNFRLSPETPFKGIFLAGQWTKPGSGMTMAIDSGRQAAKLTEKYLKSLK